MMVVSPAPTSYPSLYYQTYVYGLLSIFWFVVETCWILSNNQPNVLKSLVYIEIRRGPSGIVS